MKSSEAEVHIGDGVVVVRRSGNSVSAVANILGTEEGEGGSRLVYLDRLIHEPFESELGSYDVSGAISTIITVKPVTTVAGTSALAV
jgi:hypothetical protein